MPPDPSMDSHKPRVLVIAAYFAPGDDVDAITEASSAALGALKKPGSQGAAVAYDLSSPLNFDLLRELAERFDLDPQDAEASGA